ncbi:MAG: DUF1592 domain-containing protein [Myxococcales bacterium]
MRSSLRDLGLLCALAACDAGAPAGPALGGELDRLPGQRAQSIFCDEVHAPARRLVRLTPVEYQNTVRDVLGVEGDFGSTFPADPVEHGFGRAADRLLVTPLLADKLQAAAEDIASQADLTRFAPCLSAPDAACLKTLTEKLAAELFRRPVDDSALAPYLKLAQAAPTPAEGANRVLAAMLQSPRFLYRSELGALDDAGGLYVLDDYEVASELSYLLWQTSPDSTLREAARTGKLHTPGQITSAVDRMLTDARSRPVLRAFVKDWLGLAAIATVPKDNASFPELNQDLRTALSREVDRFVDHVLFEQGGSVRALLTSETTFLDPTLAMFYGLPDAASTMDGAPRELSEQERRGILTLGGTMLAHGRSNDSSPVQRGRLVRERLLCEVLPPPPAGIVIEPPALDPKKTSRERYAAHSEKEPCASCHRLMDPIGFAFEHFDGIGRYRPDDHGQAIDDSAQILVSSDVQGDYADLPSMIDALAQSAQVQSCYARSLLRYALSLSEDERSVCLAERSERAFAATDGSLSALIGVLTSPELLLQREQGEGAEPSLDAGPDEPGEKPDAPPASDAGTPAPEQDFELNLTVNNDWGAGYCHTFEVINRSAAALTWTVQLDLGGTLNQNWESKVSGSTGKVTFGGVDHNAVLQPGASTQFGFCVTR